MGYARIVELDIERIQLPTLPINIFSEGLGNMFTDMGLNQLSHCTIDAFADALLYFV